MGTYCTVQDVWEQIKIDAGVMEDDNVELRITQAEKWVDNYQDSTYTETIPDSIKFATACYASALILDYLFTSGEPNSSGQSKLLEKRAKDWLDSYNTASNPVESELEKVNSDFFENDTG